MPKRSVLVVDDDATMCQMLVEDLRERGFDAKFALGVEQALRLLSSERFGAVVSDVQMAPRSGFELLTALRRRQAAPPVILMTSFSAPGVAREAREAGAFGFLKKPFLPSQLSEIVDSAIPH
jgi:DNA-binding NtrC family response regulator